MRISDWSSDVCSSYLALRADEIKDGGNVAAWHADWKPILPFQISRRRIEGIKIGNLVHIDMNAARAQIHEFAQQQQRFTAIGERAGHWPDAHQPFLCDSLAGYLAAVDRKSTRLNSSH